MPEQPTIKTDTSNGNKIIQNVIGSRALPSDISVTPIVSKVAAAASEVKRPIEHQPPSVSCYPINKEIEKNEIAPGRLSNPMSIEDLVAAKKLKDEQSFSQSPSQQNNRAFQLPKGLTITEISAAAKSGKVLEESKDKVHAAVYEVQALPVLHIPEVSSGEHYDLLRKFDEANLPREKKSAKANGGHHSGLPGGHPGMPNGLLRMTASLQQKSDYSRPGVGKVMTTKVTPKDLKSQLALNKIGLSMDNGNNVKQKPRNFNGGSKQSPASSQSSSRNSSISPRDRLSGPISITARSTSSSRVSPPTPKPAGSTPSCQVSPKPLFRSSSSTKKKSSSFVGPLIPWAKRNCGPPKHSNGWTWVGEGTEQVVFLNVSQLNVFSLLDQSRISLIFRIQIIVIY